jgi:glycosyltransferase involved in cell wall biosynthesis
MKERVYRAALAEAEKNGQVHLAGMYRDMLFSISCKVPPIPARAIPKITFLAPKNWCGERHVKDMISNMPGIEPEIAYTGARYSGSLDSDLYVVRSISDLLNVSFPRNLYGRVVSVIDSERAFQSRYLAHYPMILGVIPLNERLRQDALKHKVKHAFAPLNNGAPVEQFTPAAAFPEEFTVGAAGNFSNDYFDNWKGFTNYIVPACARAGVKLSWCGWKNRNRDGSLTAPQIPLDGMPAFYRGVSCLVQMSRSEACSSITFEAMAAGLPVLSTRVGWHGENVREGILWIPRYQEETPEQMEHTVACLAAALTTLKKNPGFCRDLGASNRRFAEEHSWAKMALVWKSAFDFYISASRTGRFE